MTEIAFKAAYGSVVEDMEEGGGEGWLCIGFAEGEHDNEAYVLFRQRLSGGPVWFELGDEVFGAEDALAAASLGAGGLVIDILPARSARFGFASRVVVGLAGCEEAEETLKALQAMLGALWRAPA